MPDADRRSIFDVEPDEGAADAAADAEIEAGQFVPHNKVVEWLKSWGTPHELSCPKPESR